MPELLPYEESSLLLKIAAGDQLAFTIIYDRYRDRIFRTAVHHTGSDAIGEEIVQDVFLQLWLKRAGAGDIKNIKAYLHGIAEHLIFKAWKRSVRDRQTNPGAIMEIQATPEAILERKDYEEILRAAVERLPEKQKLTYRMIKEQGLSREEAALRLNVSAETVKSNLDHALRNIRAFCVAHIGLESGILIILRFLV